jgi:DNA-binding response OmpR family regulator
MSKILLVDDDIELTEAVRNELEASGWKVEVAHCGADANQLLQNFRYDMILLDWQMPDITGIDVCRAFRATGDTTPIIFLTGMNQIHSLEEALDIGADDYITKPFDFRVLLARIRSAQRRASGMATSTLAIRNAKLEKKQRKLTVGTIEVKLTAIEIDLVEFLMRNPDQIFSSADLFRSIWSSESNSTEDTVRVHVGMLRKKLTAAGCDDLITTIRGSGYTIQSKQPTTDNRPR